MPGTGFEGRVVVVTGSSGMAADGARHLAGLGATVVVVARDHRECDALGLPYELADLTDEAATERAFAAVRAAHARLDGLYAVAGGSGRRMGDGPLHDIPLSGWRSTLELNLTTCFLAMREALRAMLDQQPRPGGERGSIVLMSSALARSPAPRFFSTHAYAAAKAAQVGLVRATAAHYAPHGIRVNAVAPAVVDTPMARRAVTDPEIAGYLAGKQPLTAGPLSVSDVTAAAAYLLSPAARAVTGETLHVDGGWSVVSDAGEDGAS